MGPPGLSGLWCHMEREGSWSHIQSPADLELAAAPCATLATSVAQDREQTSMAGGVDGGGAGGGSEE